jgi:hypothetical protein
MCLQKFKEHLDIIQNQKELTGTKHVIRQKTSHSERYFIPSDTDNEESALSLREFINLLSPSRMLMLN